MSQESTNALPLTSFQALSFDVYATLVDWEGGILTALQPLNTRLQGDHAMRDNRQGLLELFNRNEGLLQRQYPEMKYTQLLGEIYSLITSELGLSLSEQEATAEKAAFGESVGAWPAFPDTVAALHELGKRYKLIVLSNVDGEAFSKTLAGPLSGVKFDAIYMAEQIGSYKPDLRNFEYMLDRAQKELGVDRILHTAQALWHDHVPAKKVGIPSCWIERAGEEAAMGGKLADFDGQVDISYRFRTLGDMADAVRKAFGEDE